MQHRTVGPQAADCNPSDITRDIRQMTLRAGAGFFGIADLAPARDAIAAQGGEKLAAYPRALAMGIVLPDDIVDLLAHNHDPSVARRYNEVYDNANRRLDRLAAKVAERLQSAGAASLAICASRRTDQNRLCGLFPHKTAAHLAGLGWIGRSCLLVTTGAGPRVRWVTVLTDALLEPTGAPQEQACGNCRRCVDACPAQAFSGAPFRIGEQRDARFDARKCANYVIRAGQQMGGRVLCGICMAVCPHGQRPAQQSAATPRATLKD